MILTFITTVTRNTMISQLEFLFLIYCL